MNQLINHHKLPNNVRRFKQKDLLYKKDGYSSLIHAAFCNVNSEKINEKAKMWYGPRHGELKAEVDNANM